MYLRKKVEYKKNRIIIFKDYDHSYYYLADTPDRYYAACLERLEDLNKWVTWQTIAKPEPPEISREQAEALPEGEVKQLALSKIRKYQVQLEDYVYGKELEKYRQKALEEKNGWIAETILIENNFEFETLTLMDALDED